MSKSNLTALLIGATGATGFELLQQLLTDEKYSSVKIFIRKNISLEHEKLEKHLVDFDKIETWKEKLKGDVLFSMLGTTLKVAGSKENQFKIDYTYQYEVAKFAKEMGVKTYVLISAANADAKSFQFYSKIKGQLENAVKALEFEETHIFQPGILVRNTNDGRTFETLAVKLIEGINALGMLRNYKPMPVSILAKAMRQAVAARPAAKLNYYKLSEIFKTAENP